MLRRCIYPMLWLYILSNSGPLAAHTDEKPADTLVIIDVVDWLSPAHQATHQASVLQKILANLTIPHQTQQITRNRARMLVREHPTACMPWLLKTPERLQDFQFSVPYMAENALQLAVRDNTPLAQTLHQQRQAGPIRLGELLLQRRPPSWASKPTAVTVRKPINCLASCNTCQPSTPVPAPATIRPSLSPCCNAALLTSLLSMKLWQKNTAVSWHFSRSKKPRPFN